MRRRSVRSLARLHARTIALSHLAREVLLPAGTEHKNRVNKGMLKRRFWFRPFAGALAAWREERTGFLLYFSEVPEVPSAHIEHFVKLAEDPRAKDWTQYSVQDLQRRVESAVALAKRTETLISLFDEIVGIVAGSSVCHESALADLCVVFPAPSGSAYFSSRVTSGPRE